jgi:hypothetical protein
MIGAVAPTGVSLVGLKVISMPKIRHNLLP